MANDNGSVIWIFEKAPGCQVFKTSSLAWQNRFNFPKMLLKCGRDSRNCFTAKKVACENSRPSSLPARVAFRVKAIRAGAKKDVCFLCFRRLSV